jgi:uncharacterized membrane protein YraQ (UPF0718 family)/copper chaperone CopZ
MNEIGTYIVKFLDELWFITGEMSPYLLLGFLFAGILFLLFPKNKVKRYMGKNRRGAVLNASLLGVPLPLCSCGVIPTGLSFYKNGASKGSTVSFLISTPQTGIDSMLVTYSLLGLPFALIRPIVALFTGVGGGMLTNRITRNEKEEDQDKNASKSELPKGLFPKIKIMFRYAFVEFLQDIMGWLIIGLLIAALIAVVVPDDFFAGKTSNDLLEMVIILIAAIPVYICATASVPVAAVLILKGLSPGAALVLLMAGPATNAATITMIGRVMGRKSLMGYLASIISGALIFGYIINNFLPASWFILPEHLMTHDHEMLPAWLMYGSAIVLIGLIINGYIQKFLTTARLRSDTNNTINNMKNITRINVTGMTCNHCKANVENGILSIAGVENVTADITSGEVIIEGNAPELSLLTSKVESLGYSVK